jgi:hypothetical protein
LGVFGLWKRAHEARDASTPATIESGAIRIYERAPLLPKVAG